MHLWNIDSATLTPHLTVCRVPVKSALGRRGQVEWLWPSREPPMWSEAVFVVATHHQHARSARRSLSDRKLQCCACGRQRCALTWLETVVFNFAAETRIALVSARTPSGCKQCGRSHGGDARGVRAARNASACFPRSSDAWAYARRATCTTARRVRTARLPAGCQRACCASSSTRAGSLSYWC